MANGYYTGQHIQSYVRDILDSMSILEIELNKTTSPNPLQIK